VVDAADIEGCVPQVSDLRDGADLTNVCRPARNHVIKTPAGCDWTAYLGMEGQSRTITR
jgi:hypothetical protein